MSNLSQSNLLELADTAYQKHDFQTAITYYEEALRIATDQQAVKKLITSYLQLDLPQAAYQVIKEQVDLFSDPEFQDLYEQTLVKRHFYIEALQLANLGKKLTRKVEPATEAEQQEIMTSLRQKKTVSNQDYETILQLSKVNFVAFCRSALIDPTQNFALRIALIEDLIKLGIDDQIQVAILGEITDFCPNDTMLLAQDPIYKEVVTSIADYFAKSPSNLPVWIGEINLVLGNLYPKLSTYIDDPDAFAHDFRLYLQVKNGGPHQALLERIYQFLPK